MKYKNLQQFMQSFGLARKVEGDTIEERNASFIAENAPGREHQVYCRGCGQMLMSVGDEGGGAQKRADSERAMQWHHACYQKAEANYMARMKREVNYREEQSIERDGDNRGL